MESFASRLETQASLPPRIKWKTVEKSSSSGLALSDSRLSATSAHLAQLEASSHNQDAFSVCVGPVMSSVSAIRPDFVG